MDSFVFFEFPEFAHCGSDRRFPQFETIKRTSLGGGALYFAPGIYRNVGLVFALARYMFLWFNVPLLRFVYFCQTALVVTTYAKVLNDIPKICMSLTKQWGIDLHDLSSFH